MKIILTEAVFRGKPRNYSKIDDTVSRSAQPLKEDFRWLKEQEVTDIFNFRTMHSPGLDFSEKETVEALGMKYHNIPSISAFPQQSKVQEFLKGIEQVKKNNGKAHIHCKAGADRTGMYSFIYKMFNGIGTLSENKSEWVKHGHNCKRYPNMIEWAENLVKNFKK